MATSFKGWLESWGGSWGPVTFDPNAMAGAAGFTLTATATLTQQQGATNISGAASMTFSAYGVLSALGLIDEQRTQVYGSGRKLAVPADWNTAPIREPEQLSEDELIAKVIDKWETIERARAPSPSRPDRPPAPSAPTLQAEKINILPEDAQSARAELAASMLEDEAMAVAAQRQREHNEKALVVILSLL